MGLKIKKTKFLVRTKLGFSTDPKMRGFGERAVRRNYLFGFWSE